MRTYERHPLTAQREAATRLNELLDKRAPSFQALGYDENTYELDRLLEDLAATGAAADLATLGLEDWLTDLQTASADFKAVMAEAHQSESAPDAPALQPTKRALARRFSLLFELGAFYAESANQTWIDLMARSTAAVEDLKRYGVDDDPEPEVETIAP